MPMLCARTPADQVDYENERFVVCKVSGVTAGGCRYEIGEELPRGVLNVRAMREIYDTPTRLIETMDYALSDEQLLAFMMARSSSADVDDSAAADVIAHEEEHRGPGQRKKRKP